jgi:hypothetical protein
MSSLQSGSYDEILERAFKTWKFHSGFHPMNMLVRTLYAESPKRFTVARGLHQNYETEPLHLTVRVNGDYGNYLSLHVNGFFKNGFKLTTITYVGMTPGPVVIADFRTPVTTEILISDDAASGRFSDE